MKAIAFTHCLPATDPAALQDIELPQPHPGPHDLLVRVQAVSVNPIDTKVRRTAAPPAGQPRVLGWDAVGTVQALGPQASGFAVGDRVYYAGAINRPGRKSEGQLVDARIAAHAPRSLTDGQAGALPIAALSGTTGAGDCFLAALLWALDQGAAPGEALRWGVAAGSASLLAPGSALAEACEVQRLQPQVVLQHPSDCN